MGEHYLEDWLTKRDEKTEWNGTGIKMERSVPFCDPFCFHLQSVHCPFTKTNGPFRFVKRELFFGVYCTTKLLLRYSLGTLKLLLKLVRSSYCRSTVLVRLNYCRGTDPQITAQTISVYSTNSVKSIVSAIVYVVARLAYYV